MSWSTEARKPLGASRGTMTSQTCRRSSGPDQQTQDGGRARRVAVMDWNGPAKNTQSRTVGNARERDDGKGTGGRTAVAL